MTLLDMTGAVVGSLTVIERSRSLHKGPSAHWLCECVCGRRYVFSGTRLRNREHHCLTCRRKAQTLKVAHPLYRVWRGMITRCHSKSSSNYQYYGARGITVCERWRESFWFFVEDVGQRPSPTHTLDRYPRQDGNYEPGNVRWATPTEQSCNRRCVKMTMETAEEVRRLRADGVSLAELASRFAVEDHVIYRILKGKTWKVPKVSL